MDRLHRFTGQRSSEGFSYLLQALLAYNAQKPEKQISGILTGRSRSNLGSNAVFFYVKQAFASSTVSQSQIINEEFGKLGGQMQASVAL